MPETATPDVLAQIEADARKEQRDAAAAVEPPKDEKPKRSRSRKKADGEPSRGPGRPPGARTRNRSTDSAKLAQLQPRLLELLGVIGMGVSVANAEDGRAILENAEPLAASLTQLAKENSSVRRVLFMVLETSAWGAVVMALAPILIRIGANHQMLPAQLAGLAPLFGGVAPPAPDPSPAPPVVPFDPTAEGKRDADAGGTNGAASRVV